MGKIQSRSLKRFGITAVTILGLAGCERSYSYNYRLTMQMQDGSRLVTASNVVRVTETRNGSGGARRSNLCGSALFIPLSNGRLIVATLQGRGGLGPDPAYMRFWRLSPTEILLTGYHLETEWSAKDDSGIRSLSGQRGPIGLYFNQLPELLTFKNPADPKTVTQLDPFDLPKHLGSGIRIVSAFVEPTSEWKSSSQVKKYLPWFSRGQDFLGGASLGVGVDGYQSQQLEQNECAAL